MVVCVDVSVMVKMWEGGNECVWEEAAENLGATYARALEFVFIGCEVVWRCEGEEVGDEDGVIV